MWAYLWDTEGCFGFTELFADLDPTEKAIVGYYVGMTLAKLYADQRLSVPFLMHVSRYAEAYGVVYRGTRRPDLIGCRLNDEWLVLEAKGRARVRSSLVREMRQQKTGVATIGGVPPAWRLGTATRVRKRALELRVVDPPGIEDGDGGDAYSLPAKPRMWIQTYYAPIMQLLEPETVSTSDSIVTASLPGAGLRLGLTLRLLTLLRGENLVLSDEEWLGRLGSAVAESPGANGDGVIIALGDE